MDKLLKNMLAALAVICIARMSIVLAVAIGAMLFIEVNDIN